MRRLMISGQRAGGVPKANDRCRERLVMVGGVLPALISVWALMGCAPTDMVSVPPVDVPPQTHPEEANQATGAAEVSETADAGSGLQVPGLTTPAHGWSDLMWDKHDYLAWVQGRAHRPTLHVPRQISAFPSLSSRPVDPAGALDHWDLGARSWDYAAGDGLAIRLGSSDISSAVLTRPATLGGMHIRQKSRAPRDENQAWSLSFSLGALDLANGAGNGDLSYGPMAAHTVVQYGLDENIALESAVQVAPDMVTTSLGARFDAGSLGALSGGFARGGLDARSGRRYQAAYELNLPDDWRFSVSNEWQTPGFVDLGHYHGGVTGGVRRSWTATIPTRSWGDITSTFETWQPVTGPDTQRLGFSQQFWYSPNLRIGLQAQRELGTGDYDIGIHFSVPIK